VEETKTVRDMVVVVVLMAQRTSLLSNRYMSFGTVAWVDVSEYDYMRLCNLTRLLWMEGNKI
jgi:hypothetical protein